MLAAADGWAAVALGLVGLASAAWAAIGRPADAPIARAVSAAAIVAGSARLALPGPLGLETVVAVVVLTALVVLGMRAGPSRAIRPTLAVAAGVAVVAGVAAALFGVAALGARGEVERGEAEARRGMRALADGELDRARGHFAEARRLLAGADADVDTIWTRPAGLVPVVAQHRRAVTTVTGEALATVETIADSLERVDLDAVRPVDGRVDLGALGDLTAELEAMRAAAAALDAALTDTDSPWLVGALADRVDALDRELDERIGQADDALAALAELPALLGAEGERVYFVALVTPAEARGSIGFMGNFAELTTRDGAIELTAFGRSDDLDQSGDPADRRITGMPEFLDRYGDVGFSTGPNGSIARDGWKIVTMSPDFPTVAEVIAQLYPASGGRPIDGVIALDTKVVAALLEFTGPVEVVGLDRRLDADNAEEYLLVDQYVDFGDERDERIDALELLGRHVFDELLDGGLPEPIELGRRLAPLADGGHLAAWMREAAEQDLVERAGIDLRLPDRSSGDGAVIAFNNGSGGKQEVFLHADVRYDRVIGTDGQAAVELTIELTNDAPTEGLPSYLIGSGSVVPPGTNRLQVSVYTAGPADEVVLDGVALDVARGTGERGWPVFDTSIDIDSRETRTLVVRFRAPAADEPEVRVPNLRHPVEVTVTTR